ncbi:hypothetical protein Taro_047144 [Colocasia esculenta]|uniref:CASP-like protein n=1 Tax=Colocasia esculenta TaxID=4460 RepID=A0A843X527_COLES|nr:hypothetical protein [Colocasia esculenta]
MPEPESAPLRHPSPNHFRADVPLRLLLLLAALAGLLLVLTSKQTELIPFPFPPYAISHTAKWTHSPAFVYLVVALAAGCLYSVVTLVAAATWSRPATLLFLLIISDAMMAGVLAAATGTGGAIGYLGVKGNSHVNWGKVCNVYGKFCRHIGSGVALALAASVLLVTLVALSSHSLYRRSR